MPPEPTVYRSQCYLSAQPSLRPSVPLVRRVFPVLSENVSLWHSFPSTYVLNGKVNQLTSSRHISPHFLDPPVVKHIHSTTKMSLFLDRYDSPRPVPAVSPRWPVRKSPVNAPPPLENISPYSAGQSLLFSLIPHLQTETWRHLLLSDYH